MSAETETIVRRCCSMCLIVPDDPAALKNFGNPAEWSRYRNYWLCKDQAACVERASAAQRKARDAVLAAIEAEKRAMEAGDASAGPEGKHAATGPLQAVTDTAVAEMTEAAQAGEDAPADGEASDD